MSPFIARNGPPAMSAVRSLSGGKRTSLGRPILVEIDPQRTLAHEETLSRVNDIACFGWRPEAPAQCGRSHFCRLSDRPRAARKCGGEKLTPCERHKIDFTDTL